MLLRKNILKSFNGLFAAIYAYCLYYDYNLTASYRFTPDPERYLSKLVWLTMINLYLHFFYHSTAALLAILNVRKQSVLNGFDFCATAIVFPTGLTVVVLFWGLVYLDPTHLVGEDAQIIFAVKWFNHSIHTLPLFAMLLDLIVWRHTRPSKLNAAIAIFAFLLLYMIDIHYFYFAYNYWAYPILGNLSLPGRVLFLLVCSLFYYGAFLIGDVFNMLLHAKFLAPKLSKNNEVQRGGKRKKHFAGAR